MLFQAGAGKAFVSSPAEAKYVSTPSVRQGSRLQRPASIQLVDHYEEIPADLPSPPPSARRHASFDLHLYFKPQPPIPAARGVVQGHAVVQGQGQGHGGTVESMTRKPSYDENDVILIDSAIYG